MKIETHIPIDTLKPFVKAFMLIECEDGMDNKILPATSITIAFRYKGMVSYEEDGIKNSLPLSVVSGLRKSPRLICYSQRAATFLIVFKEGAASSFFNEPLSDFFGLYISLDTFITTGKLKEIEERLAEAKNNTQRVFFVEQFFLSKLKEPKPDLLVLEAIKKIQLASGDIRIKKLIADLHISQDPFEKRFRRLTGTSPKQFASIVRLRSVIENHSQDKTLTDTALTAGYFDQAHFIKDFKTFTGQTPQQFFKFSAYW